MIEFLLVGIPSFGVGFAACWYSKDWLIMAYDGTTNFARRLEDKAAKLRGDK